MIFFNFNNKEFKEVMTRAGVVVVKKDHLERLLSLLTQYAFPTAGNLPAHILKAKSANLLCEIQEELNNATQNDNLQGV